MKKNIQNGTEVLGLIANIQEQLTALNKKIDALMMRSLVSNTVAPVERKQNEQPKGKPMYQVICADCKKECTIPFKPSGDRPVYCKECFSRRRGGNPVKAQIDNKPKEQMTLAVPQEVINAAPAKEVKKKTAAKKVVAKKKPVAKKKRK